MNELFIHFLAEKENQQKIDQLYQFIQQNIPYPQKLVQYNNEANSHGANQTLISQLPVKTN